MVAALCPHDDALFYALQWVLALIVSIKDGKGTNEQRIGSVAIGLICLVAGVVDAAAER